MQPMNEQPHDMYDVFSNDACREACFISSVESAYNFKQ
jgi:hypothetical protein